MQEIKALEANIGSFQQILDKYLPFPHQSLVKLTKNWLKTRYIQLFHYRSVKTLVKFKKK